MDAAEMQKRTRLGELALSSEPLLVSLPSSILQHGYKLEFGGWRCRNDHATSCSTMSGCLRGLALHQWGANLSRFSPSLFIKYLLIYGKRIRCKFTTNSSYKHSPPLGTSQIFLDITPWTITGFHSWYIKPQTLFLQEKTWGLKSLAEGRDM